MQLHVHERALLFAGDLLLEEGVHHDAGGTGVFEALDHAHVVNQGRGTGHQGMGQLETEVRGFEIHGCLSFPWG